MFELTNAEKNELVTKCDKLQSLKFNPSKVKAFTEQGVYMLATILDKLDLLLTLCPRV